MCQVTEEKGWREGKSISDSVAHLSNWGHPLPAAGARTTLSAPTALLQVLNILHMGDSTSLLTDHWSPASFQLHPFPLESPMKSPVTESSNASHLQDEV